MGNGRALAVLSLIGVLLTGPFVLSVSSSGEKSHSDSLPAGLGDKRPQVVKRSIQSCSSSFENFCLNHGECMYLVDEQSHHCKCEKGYHGPRCAVQELVVQPMAEEQFIVIVFCAGLLIVGLSAVLYVCCKWYRKKRFPDQHKRHSYKGVQTA